jgi:hypothetical protein
VVATPPQSPGMKAVIELGFANVGGLLLEPGEILLFLIR